MKSLILKLTLIILIPGGIPAILGYEIGRRLKEYYDDN